MLRINNKLVLLGFGMVVMSNVFALKSDEKQPIQIVADSATADQINKVTVFTGHVVMTRGSILVNANRAEARQDATGNKIIHVVGTPVTFEQMNDDGEKTTGQCNDFEYSTKNSLAVLTGRARVKKGDNLVMGDKLTYNTQTQIYSAVSNKSSGVSDVKSGRVTVILQPDKGQGNNGAF